MRRSIGHEWHGPYHDREYGFPLDGDAELFERLVLEIIQAGLSRPGHPERSEGSLRPGFSRSPLTFFLTRSRFIE